jgi:hypothetical protein
MALFNLWLSGETEIPYELQSKFLFHMYFPNLIYISLQVLNTLLQINTWFYFTRFIQTVILSIILMLLCSNQRRLSEKYVLYGDIYME